MKVLEAVLNFVGSTCKFIYHGFLSVTILGGLQAYGLVRSIFKKDNHENNYPYKCNCKHCQEEIDDDDDWDD